MIKSIVLYPDELLQQPCVEIPKQDELWNLKQDLWDTLQHYKGYGLAAPQIGIRKRAFICRGAFCVDPKVIRSGSSTSVEEEGCLSVPGTYIIVERPDWVKVTYNTLSGTAIQSKLVGFDARVFQHELDHLNGILIIDKENKMKKTFSIDNINNPTREQLREIIDE